MSDFRSTAPIVGMFACLSDNYGYILHDPTTGDTACIDTPDADAILAYADKKGWKISQIWNTHWHRDHAGGNEKIKAETGCTIYAPAEIAARLNAPVDVVVHESDTLTLGAFKARVLETPGHTLEHVAYYLPDSGMAFVGDTLFALGCGRMFEGDPAMMWASLSKLASLPPDTQIYCAHEYTLANLAFAETVDPDNPELAEYGARVRALRKAGKPTIPTSIKAERAANPFLRADTSPLQTRTNRVGDATATFAELRRRKDSF